MKIWSNLRDFVDFENSSFGERWEIWELFDPNHFQPFALEWRFEYIVWDDFWSLRRIGLINPLIPILSFCIFFEFPFLEGNYNFLNNDHTMVGFFPVESCNFYELFAIRTTQFVQTSQKLWIFPFSRNRLNLVACPSGITTWSLPSLLLTSKDQMNRILK